MNSTKGLIAGRVSRLVRRIIHGPLIHRYWCKHDWEFRGFNYRMNYWEEPSKCEKHSEVYWCRMCGDERISKIPNPNEKDHR